MQVFFSDGRKVGKAGEVVGHLSPEALAELFERRRLPAGTPVVLDDTMRPVEPLTTWFRSLALGGMRPRSLRVYAYTSLMLLNFLRSRGLELATATEADIQEFRLWRLQDAATTVDEVTWDKDGAVIGALYDHLASSGVVEGRPWRSTRRGRSLSSGTERDLRVRHMTLEQYLFFRDVGFGGLGTEAEVDAGFRGWWPHRNRAAVELALLTGMRIQEWSTLLMLEVEQLSGRGGSAQIELGACAKGGRARSVYVPGDAMAMLESFLLLERPEIVARAQRSLRRARRDLFVVTAVEAGGARVRGVFDGVSVSRPVKQIPPEVRRLMVIETGDGLDPAAVFLGWGGRMLTAGGWDRVRWRAWERLQGHAADSGAPVSPRRCWVYHDLRHTFALRLLIYLTREALRDAAEQRLPTSSLLDHMTGNPLLVVQRRLGHAQPATTYRYIRYLKDPMREVDEAFRAWSAEGGASYAQIARRLLELEDADAAAR